MGDFYSKLINEKWFIQLKDASAYPVRVLSDNSFIKAVNNLYFKLGYFDGSQFPNALHYQGSRQRCVDEGKWLAEMEGFMTQSLQTVGAERGDMLCVTTDDGAIQVFLASVEAIVHSMRHLLEEPGMLLIGPPDAAWIMVKDAYDDMHFVRSDDLYVSRR